MNYQTILVEKKESIATITINRPDKMNALNREVMNELDVALNALLNDMQVRGIIITGAGEKSFVAGADIAEFVGIPSDEARTMAQKGHRIFNQIECATKPVIAAVNGFALGGGCELAMACHIRIASSNARFGQPEINLGLIPGYGGTQRLTKLVGRGKALELLLTGNAITADEALQSGLVNHVVAPENLMTKCIEILKKISLKSPLVVDQLIACVNACEAKAEDGFELEIDEFGNCFETNDFKEGVSAFMEKRQAAFSGK